MSLQKLGFCVKIMVFKSQGKVPRDLDCDVVLVANTTQNMAELGREEEEGIALQGLPTYIILPWYNNAPVPNRRSFAGKIDKICPKTSKRL